MPDQAEVVAIATGRGTQVRATTDCLNSRATDERMLPLFNHRQPATGSERDREWRLGKNNYGLIQTQKQG